MGTRDQQGQPMPSLKNCTLDTPIVQSMVAASEYFLNLRPVWNNHVPFFVPVDRTERFASRIHRRCIYEACAHTIDPLCEWHSDTQNPAPTDAAVSNVTTIYRKLRLGKVVTSIFYFRLSISLNISLREEGDPIVNHFRQTYREFPPERRSFTSRSVGNQRSFFHVLPNLDPIGFHNLFLICQLTMVDRFSLNLFETISLSVAMMLIPNTAEPFARAAIDILREGPLNADTTGYHVGFDLYNRMLLVERTLPMRFNLYRTPERVSNDFFFDTTRRLFFLVLHVWASHPSRPANNQIQRIYNAIRELVKSTMHGAGNLVAMHTITMMADFGLLPSWLQTYVSIDTTGRVFQWYGERFSISTTQASAKKFMQSVKTALETSTNLSIPEVVIENLACKNFQRYNRRTESKRDVHFGGSPIVLRSEDSRGLLLLVNNNRIILEGNCLVNRWTFGEETLTMAEIARTLELPPALPGARSLTAGELPREIRARPSESLVYYFIPNWYL